jgi:hypothetical protein
MDAVEAFNAAARSTWQGGTPRNVLEASGSVTRRFVNQPSRNMPAVRTGNLESKDVFVEGSDFVDGTWAQIGSHFGEAFVRAESEAVATLLRHARKRHLPGTLAERARAAASLLRDAGLTPSHLFMPPQWQIQVLDSNLPQDVDGLAVIEWFDCPDDSCFVLALPNSIRATQYVVAGDELAIDIRAIGDDEEAELHALGIDDVDGDEADTPSERIRSRVWIRIHEYVKFERGRLVRFAIDE